jgi:hypothetical protein
MQHSVVDEFVNPNGVPDKFVPEAEARLWLLSEADRRNGGQVHFDGERWVVSSASHKRVKQADCTACGKSFVAARATARYCSEACKKKAQRGQCPAKNPRPSWDMHEAISGA